METNRHVSPHNFCGLEVRAKSVGSSAQALLKSQARCQASLGSCRRLESFLEIHVVVGIHFFADVGLTEAVSLRPALLLYFILFF